MEKVKKYETAILSFLEEYAAGFDRQQDGVETQVIADREGHHYQLFRVGWRGAHFIHNCLFHFDIKNGKVWIQQNETEVLVGDELVSRGIPKDDIVLGFQPKEVRLATGFGVA